MMHVSNEGMVCGKPKLVQVTTASGGGGNVTVALQPPANTIWLPIVVAAYQDEGLLTYSWNLFDAAGVAFYSTTLAASARVYFYRDVPSAHPLVLTRQQYLYFMVFTMAAGKNAYVDAWVHQITGVGTV